MLENDSDDSVLKEAKRQMEFRIEKIDFNHMSEEEKKKVILVKVIFCFFY
jgi:hypothetical protein